MSTESTEAKTENETTAQASPCSQLLERFDAISSNAYHRYIELCRKDECLGWEAKVDCKQFGYNELRAHMDAQEMLGKHRAFAEAAKMLREAL